MIYKVKRIYKSIADGGIAIIVSRNDGKYSYLEKWDMLQNVDESLVFDSLIDTSIEYNPYVVSHSIFETIDDVTRHIKDRFIVDDV